MNEPPREEALFGLTTGRLAALCDGVLAISMTLLVVTLSDLYRTVGTSKTYDETLARLLGLWPYILAYVLSFLLVGVYWIVHHIMFHYIQRADRVLLWLNMMFLLCIAFVPFSTGLLAECMHHEFNLVVASYGAAHVLTGSWLLAVWKYATWNHRLVSPDMDPAVIRALTRTVLLGPLCYLAGILVSFFSIPIGLVIYLVIPLFYLLPSRVDHHWMFLGRRLAERPRRKGRSAPTAPDDSEAEEADVELPATVYSGA